MNATSSRGSLFCFMVSNSISQKSCQAQTNFLQFLGKRSDDPMTEVTKQDVVAFRNRLITQVSAKTANHDLRALKMLFKSARRDGVVTEDPTEFVETVWRERRPKIKRPFTLPELLRVLDLAA